MTSTNLEIPAGVTTILETFAVSLDQTRASGAAAALQAHIVGLIHMAAASVVSIAGLPQCQIAYPHQNIQVGFDSSHNLRLECLHSPRHCWTLSGTQCSC